MLLQEYNRQEGYGFVTFLRDEDARVALNSLGTTEINGVRFVSCLSNKVKVAMGVISPSKLNRPIGKSSFNSSPSISDESLSPRVNTRGLSDNYFHQSIPNLTPPLPYSYANNTQNQTPSHHSRPFQKPQVYGSQYYSQPQYPAPNGGLPQTDHIHSQGNGNFPQMHQPSDGPSQPPASSIPPYSQMQPPPPPHYPYMSNYPHPNAMSVMPINFGQPQMLMPQQPAAMYPTMYSSPPSVNNPPNTPGFYHSQQPSVVPAYPSVHVMYPQQETHAYPSSSSTTSSSMSSRIEIPPYPSDNMHPSATQMQATSGYMHYPPSVNKSIHPPQK